MRLWSEVKLKHRESVPKVVCNARNRQDYGKVRPEVKAKNVSDSWHAEQLKETSRTLQHVHKIDLECHYSSFFSSSVSPISSSPSF